MGLGPTSNSNSSLWCL